MANRSFISQFTSSFEKQVVHLMGAFTVNAVLTKAALSVHSGAVVLTAVSAGAAGNNITLALVDPGAASQSLSITVVGNAISVSLATDSGSAITTDYAALKAALLANSSVTALVAVTGSGGATLAVALTATHLAGGLDSSISNNLPIAIMSLQEIGVGSYQLTLADQYIDLLSIGMTMQCASATDLVPQVASADVGGTRVIAIRTLTGATPTSITQGDSIYIDLNLRNVR